MKYLPFIAAGLLLIGIAELPIGFYTFLRIVVCFVAILLAIVEYSKMQEVSICVIICGIVAITFNPIIPIYLHDSSIWHVIDFVTAIFFGILGVRNYDTLK